MKLATEPSNNKVYKLLPNHYLHEMRDMQIQDYHQVSEKDGWYLCKGYEGQEAYNMQ